MTDVLSILRKGCVRSGMAFCCTAILFAASFHAFAGQPENRGGYACGSDGVSSVIRDSIAFAGAEWNWKTTPDGAEYASVSINMFNSVQTISAVRYNSRSYRTAVVHSPGEGRGTVSSLGAGKDADIAINGGYFNMSTLYPTTYVRVKGREKGFVDKGEMLYRSNGAIAFGRKDIRIYVCDTVAGYSHIPSRYRDVLAAGPVLVEDGRIVCYPDKNGFYASRHPRSLIGYTEDGMVYMVVIDGRFKGMADGTTIWETAFIAKMFGLEDALNLDGGGSSSLWTAESGVLNHPADNGKFDNDGEREVPNCIIAAAR